MDIQLSENEIIVLCSYKNEKEKIIVNENIITEEWNPDTTINGGFIGLPWGTGDIKFLSKDPLSQWMLVVVNNEKDYIENTGKLLGGCKFKQGKVLFVGEKKETISMLQSLVLEDKQIVFSEQHNTDDKLHLAGEHSFQTGSSNAKQKAGDKSNQTASTNSYQHSGNNSIQNSDDSSEQISGINSIQITGDKSIQTAGINTVQISKWTDEHGSFHISSRIVDSEMSNKKYYVEKGVWTKIDS